jgi:hypothetical protein
VRSDLARESASVILLHGVTGSGKTEVYLRLLPRCLKRGVVCFSGAGDRPDPAAFEPRGIFLRCGPDRRSPQRNLAGRPLFPVASHPAGRMWTSLWGPVPPFLHP